MGAVLLNGQGYCYMDRVRILTIEGEDVTCVVEFLPDSCAVWKNGAVYTCRIDDLWPPYREI
jgi:hypothetical protein